MHIGSCLSKRFVKLRDDNFTILILNVFIDYPHCDLLIDVVNNLEMQIIDRVYLPVRMEVWEADKHNLSWLKMVSLINQVYVLVDYWLMHISIFLYYFWWDVAVENILQKFRIEISRVQQNLEYISLL